MYLALAVVRRFWEGIQLGIPTAERAYLDDGGRSRVRALREAHCVVPSFGTGSWATHRQFGR